MHSEYTKQFIHIELTHVTISSRQISHPLEIYVSKINNKKTDHKHTSTIICILHKSAADKHQKYCEHPANN